MCVVRKGKINNNGEEKEILREWERCVVEIERDAVGSSGIKSMWIAFSFQIIHSFIERERLFYE